MLLAIAISKNIATFAHGSKKFLFMAKVKAKAKDPIRLWFKKLASGSQAVYLVYHSHGKRTYENLGLYIIPERTQADKAQNANTLLTVNTIKAQRIVELANDKAGIKQDKARGKMLLVDWLEHFKAIKLRNGQSKSNAVTINNLILHIKAYKGDAIMMKQVDKAFCEGFITYLSTCKTIGTLKPKKGEHKPKPMAKATATLYFNTFVCALNSAVKAEIIESNPVAKIDKDTKKPIKNQGSTRTYLSLDEIKALMGAKCPNEELKRAFFFACFCGLRISDIKKLTWAEIQQDGEQLIVNTTMKKTGKAIVLPISKEAAKWLPKRGDNDIVFCNLPTQSTINEDMKVWAERAGITKDIVFHTSRHTFATTALTLGADLYTTSKLLGHQNLRTTQIYAEIVNQKKTDAVNLFNGILNN